MVQILHHIESSKQYSLNWNNKRKELTFTPPNALLYNCPRQQFRRSCMSSNSSAPRSPSESLSFELDVSTGSIRSVLPAILSTSRRARRSKRPSRRLFRTQKITLSFSELAMYQRDCDRRDHKPAAGLAVCGRQSASPASPGAAAAVSAASSPLRCNSSSSAETAQTSSKTCHCARVPLDYSRS